VAARVHRVAAVGVAEVRVRECNVVLRAEVAAQRRRVDAEADGDTALQQLRQNRRGAAIRGCQLGLGRK